MDRDVAGPLDGDGLAATLTQEGEASSFSSLCETGGNIWRSHLEKLGSEGKAAFLANVRNMQFPDLYNFETRRAYCCEMATT